MSLVQPASASPHVSVLAGHTSGLFAGHGRMSRTQAWELLYLSQRAEQPELYEEDLSAADADLRIARLRLQLDG